MLYKRRIKIKRKIRSVVVGTKDRPRLSVYKSNKRIYAQLIDDNSGKTIIGISSSAIKSGSKVSKLEISKKLGELIAQKAKLKKISEVVFDRGGYRYHGRVKALAEGAREGGLKF